MSPLGFWQIDYVNTFYVESEDVIMMCPCFAVEVSTDAIVRLSEEHTAFEWVEMFEQSEAELGSESVVWRPKEAAIGRLMWPGQRVAVREIVAEIVSGNSAEPHLRVLTTRR